MRVINTPYYEFTPEEVETLRGGCSVFGDGYRYFMLADGELLRVPDSTECLYLDSEQHNVTLEEV